MGKFIFRAILHPAEEGGYWVDVPALDGCFTEGDSFREAVEMAADAMKTYVATLMKYGDPIPGYETSEVPEGCLFSDVFSRRMSLISWRGLSSRQLRRLGILVCRRVALRTCWMRDFLTDTGAAGVRISRLNRWRGARLRRALQDVLVRRRCKRDLRLCRRAALGFGQSVVKTLRNVCSA